MPKFSDFVNSEIHNQVLTYYIPLSCTHMHIIINLSHTLYTVPPICTEGSVRLANQTFDSLGGLQVIGGRVDVCVNGSFRAVCDSGWDDLDAAVVCSSMGYNSPYYGKL